MAILLMLSVPCPTLVSRSANGALFVLFVVPLLACLSLGEIDTQGPLDGFVGA